MVNTERLCMGCMNDNGGEKICPICGHNSSQDNGQGLLSVGSWLNANRYLVGKAIGWHCDMQSVGFGTHADVPCRGAGTDNDLSEVGVGNRSLGCHKINAKGFD